MLRDNGNSPGKVKGVEACAPWPSWPVTTALATKQAAAMGGVYVDMQALSGPRAAVFLHMHSGGHAGLEVSFHGTAAEARALAIQLMRHAKAAEQAQASWPEVTSAA